MIYQIISHTRKDNPPSPNELIRAHRSGDITELSSVSNDLSLLNDKTVSNVSIRERMIEKRFEILEEPVKNVAERMSTAYDYVSALPEDDFKGDPGVLKKSLAKKVSGDLPKSVMHFAFPMVDARLRGNLDEFLDRPNPGYARTLIGVIRGD